MAAAATLKNPKILISLRPIDRFWQNLACWCDSTFWTPIANKISRFQKSKMAAAAILKIPKKSQYLRKEVTDFDNIWYSDASEPSRYRQQIKIHDFENPRWRRPPSWKIESLNTFATDDRFGQNLGRWCASTFWTPIANKISWFRKSKIAAAAIFKIRKKCNISATTDFDEICYSDASGPYRC